MARALRLQCPGSRYQVTARGNHRAEIFWNEFAKRHGDTPRFDWADALDGCV